MTALLRKTAFLTGATSGIGKAIALLFAQKGCNLICVGRNMERLENLKKEITRNISFYSFECDLANEKEVVEVMQVIAAGSLKVDILIHSAAEIKINPIITSPIEDYHSTLNLNLKAPFLITKLLLPKLKENKGQIVFINTTAIQRVVHNRSFYAVSKIALKGFTDNLRQEVNPFGIRVTSVFPGKTATPMQEKLHKKENNPYQPKKLIQAEDIASLIAGILELPETAEVTDLYIRPAIK